ncbi:MAG: hypothetical protein ACOX9R_07020 [Armatimonadota bacterium]|jgi:hypothetical protein
MANPPWYIDESRRRRVAQWLAFVVLVAGFTLFMLLTMRDMWVVEFSLSSAASEPVEVTPIGRWDVTGLVGALPQPPESRYALRRPAGDPGTVALAPGETVTIRFDYDDISFTHLLVRTPDGRVLLQPVTHETQRRLRNTYTVRPLDELSEAPRELLSILGGAKVEYTPEPTDAPPRSD